MFIGFTGHAFDSEKEFGLKKDETNHLSGYTFVLQNIREEERPNHYAWIADLHVSDASGKEKWTMPVPIGAVKLVAFFLDHWSWFPVTRDQLTMLSYGNVCESGKYFAEYSIDEISFDIKNLYYLS